MCLGSAWQQCYLGEGDGAPHPAPQPMLNALLQSHPLLLHILNALVGLSLIHAGQQVGQGELLLDVALHVLQLIVELNGEG
jgi:hypothetical protein